jgi:Ca2+-binding EF-hand superfamily protein
MRGVSILLAIVVAGGVIAPPAVAQRRADPMEMLQQADANRDGAVSRVEFLTARRARFGQMDRNGDGWFTLDDIPRIARNRAGDRVGQLTANFDADRDGRLSRDEFVNGPTRLFDLGDRDRNGLLDARELETMKAAVAARKGN